MNDYYKFSAFYVYSKCDSFCFFITSHLVLNMIQFATYLGEYAVSGVVKNGLGCYVC